ncbi:hypothetical protein MSBR2_2358 [Methanosarcina barkeri 227]|uniref:Uncharacterized protein n=2 Tax=Methanosarcina barkeri TaxID=2208 RepID=A0A0E3QVA0_METBA|nr:hypothetical protein MSBRM_2392 [Methanosarcina barkeri MS]AKB58874.1 hypothetical protein MSBR2_2358 [Methanosarcina barkeri 227]
MSNFNFIYLIFINYFIEAVISNRKKHYSCPFILYRNTLRRGGNLLSEALVDLEKTRPEYLEKEILRAAMIAEL